MLEKPDLPDRKLVACLQNDYRFQIAEIAFLPLGADVNTAVYRAVTHDGTAYFLKLRSGEFNPAAVAIPEFLSSQGIPQVIAPIETFDHRLWAHVDAYTAVLCPFIAAQPDSGAGLSDRHWIELGAALKGLHRAVPPAALVQQIPHDDYSPHWREMVRTFQRRIDAEIIADPVSAELADLMRVRREQISRIVLRAEQLAAGLRARSPDQVLCHADLHHRNVLVDTTDALYIVDWDTLIFAPKERDLMFIGGGVGGVWNKARESALFYQGYGQTEIDQAAVVYYRYERIVEDITAYCEEILSTEGDAADRRNGLLSVASQFLPNNVVDMAYASDAQLLTG